MSAAQIQTLETQKLKRKTFMKKQQNNSTRGWALHVALSIALLSISPFLLASSSKATPAYTPFTFGNTGSLNTGRYWHTATLLPNGKVLVAGGYDGVNYLSSAELYDPATGTWTATGSLGAARAAHTATLLPNGMVLVAGGDDSSFNRLASAELYAPASGSWSVTGAPYHPPPSSH